MIFFIFSDEEDLDEEVCIILLVCTAVDDLFFYMQCYMKLIYSRYVWQPVGFIKISTCTVQPWPVSCNYS